MRPARAQGNLHQVPVERVSEDADGKYTFEYTPFAEGDYVISVKLDSEDVQNTPAAVRSRRAANGARSWAKGEGLLRGLLRKPNEFTVHAFGDDGRVVLGAACVVRICGLRERDQPGFLGHDASEARARSQRHKG